MTEEEKELKKAGRIAFTLTLISYSLIIITLALKILGVFD
jgi:hypothetical protein